MSQAKECDRCGALYKHYDRSDLKLATGKKCSCVYNSIRLVRAYLDNTYGPGAFVDLCPKCMDQLEKWLSSKEVQL